MKNTFNRYALLFAAYSRMLEKQSRQNLFEKVDFVKSVNYLNENLGDFEIDVDSVGGDLRRVIANYEVRT
jgi:hypothetical protein